MKPKFKRFWQGTEHPPDAPIPGEHLSKLGNGYLLHMYALEDSYVFFLPFATVVTEGENYVQVYPPYMHQDIKHTAPVLTVMVKARQLKKFKKSIIQCGHFGQQILPFIHELNENKVVVLSNLVRRSLFDRSMQLLRVHPIEASQPI